MLKLYVQTHCWLKDRLEGLRRSKRGAVSFEYILVAACVVGAVAAAFGPGATGAIKVALSDGILAVVTLFNGAI
jgi:pilus assembly protein Flp/PilA